jgi:hypothetical protein
MSRIVHPSYMAELGARRMRAVIVAVVLVSSGTAAWASGPGVTLWKGLKHGDTVEQVRKALPKAVELTPEEAEDQDSLMTKGLKLEGLRLEHRPSTIYFLFGWDQDDPKRIERLKKVITRIPVKADDPSRNVLEAKALAISMSRTFGPPLTCSEASPSASVVTEYSCEWYVGAKFPLARHIRTLREEDKTLRVRFNYNNLRSHREFNISYDQAYGEPIENL